MELKQYQREVIADLERFLEQLEKDDSGLQTCIVPLLSYTYAKGAYGRCRRVVKNSVLLAMICGQISAMRKTSGGKM